MKDKKANKERKQEREIANKDIKWEYENLIGDEILDEIALCECLAEEDE